MVITQVISIVVGNSNIIAIQSLSGIKYDMSARSKNYNFHKKGFHDDPPLKKEKHGIGQSTSSFTQKRISASLRTI